MDNSTTKANREVEAARWLTRRRDTGKWTNADEASFQDWLAEEPWHREEFEKAEAMMAEMDSGWSPSMQQEIEDAIREADAFRERTTWRRRWVLTGGVGAATAIALGLWVISSGPKIYETGIAERRTIELKDGTQVHLDAMSIVSIDLGARLRNAELLQGRAVFDVARDEGRPFEVAAGDGKVRVLGTVFEVNLITANEEVAGHTREGVLEVAVSEGLVSVERTETAINLEPGSRVVWKMNDTQPQLASFKVAEFGDWREGRLVYENRPLRWVLVDLRKEYGGEIFLMDPSLADLPVSGTFQTEELQETFRLLAHILPINIRVVDNGRTLLVDRRVLSD